MGTYGWGEPSVAIAVVEAVAAEAECEPDELTSLYDVIDPDALERFFEVGATADRPEHRVAFTYAGYDVEVSGDRRIEVTPSEAPIVS